MQLWISDSVAEKIWYKNRRQISTEDVQQAWAIYRKSNDDNRVVYDTREDQDPPLQWILVKFNRDLMKLVFATYEEEDEQGSAYLVTAYYVDKTTRRAYEDQGGIIYE